MEAGVSLLKSTPIRAVTVALEGEWTIERANELKHVLLDALGTVDHLLLDFEKVEAVDLTCLQLLCSAHRSAIAMKKHMSVTGRQSEAFDRLLREAGFMRSVGCHPERSAECLWMRGCRK
jgi:anti-anti-sigma regulatory factor